MFSIYFTYIVHHIIWCYNFCFNLQMWFKKIIKKDQLIYLPILLLFFLSKFSSLFLLSFPFSLENLFTHSFRIGFLVTNSFIFLLPEYLLSIHSWRIIWLDVDFVPGSSFFQHLKNVVPLPSGVTAYPATTPPRPPSVFYIGDGTFQFCNFHFAPFCNFYFLHLFQENY